MRSAFRELLVVISRAGDIGMGNPDDRGVRAALVAHGLAKVAGLSPREVRDAVYVTLFRLIGCTAESGHATAVMGDEVAYHGGMYGSMHFAEPAEFLAFMWRMAGRGRGLSAQLASFVRTASMMPALFETGIAHCEVNDLMVRRIGLDETFRRVVADVYETWNGRGLPSKKRGTEIALPARVSAIADELEAGHRLAGTQGALALSRKRGGRVFDPGLCRTFEAHAEEVLAPLGAPSPLSALAALELEDEPALDERILDATCEAIADFADLKCRMTAGHSRAVAQLSTAASQLLRVPTGERELLRRAALLHDVGRVSVSAGIWDKAGPLSDAERGKVEQHTFATERILGRAAAVAPIAEVAALAHERLDGSGYHRRLPAVASTLTARLLAAADVYQALRSDRPHRSALAPERAAVVLREEARTGRLDGQAVEAVLAAAGERPAVRPEAPAGLTEREVEVLTLLARGLTNKEIAAKLGVANKTAGNHVQNVLDKLGVRTRSAAAVIAMRQGLVS